MRKQIVQTEVEISGPPTSTKSSTVENSDVPEAAVTN